MIVFQDFFTQPDGDPLNPINWEDDFSHGFGGFIQIISNAVAAKFDSINTQEARCLVTVPSDLGVQIKYIGDNIQSGGNHNTVILLRMTTDGSGFSIWCEWQATFTGFQSGHFNAFVNGFNDLIPVFNTDVLSNDVLRAEIHNDSLLIYTNGALIAQCDNLTSKIEAMQPGLSTTLANGSCGFAFDGQVLTGPPFSSIAVLDNFQIDTDFIVPPIPPVPPSIAYPREMNLHSIQYQKRHNMKPFWTPESQRKLRYR